MREEKFEELAFAIFTEQDSMAPYLSENLILIKEGTNVLRMVLTDGGGEEINVCEEIEAIWDKLIRKYS